MMRACKGLDPVLFADDMNIFAEGSNPAEHFERVNRGLEELSRLFRCNRLTLNLKKTEYDYFTEGLHRLGGSRDKGKRGPLFGCLGR